MAPIGVAALVCAVAACGDDDGNAAGAAGAGDLEGSITVFAAASLTDAFNSIGDQFKAEHPRARVQFSYAGSSTLVTQIQQGAPADVFASADQPNMQKVVEAGLSSGEPTVFARNRLEIVVQAGNPKQIRGLADLTGPGLKVDACAPAVPCGSYAATAVSKAGMRVTPVSQEDNVRAVVTKVSLGEADAGIVYTTDVKAGGDKVQGVGIPDSENVVASYPMVRLKAAANPAAAGAFADFVAGAEGQKTLAVYGFLPPAQ